MRQRNVTQTELGRLIGLSQPAVHRRLHGVRRWQVGELVTIAQAWDISLDELIGSGLESEVES